MNYDTVKLEYMSIRNFIMFIFMLFFMINANVCAIKMDRIKNINCHHKKN